MELSQQLCVFVDALTFLQGMLMCLQVLMFRSRKEALNLILNHLLIFTQRI